MNQGDKIKFASEKLPYTVNAFDGRFAICTKPFNLKKTVLYTILDLKEGNRSTNSFLWNPYDYAKKMDIKRCLEDLRTGKCELSYRNAISIDIKKL